MGTSTSNLETISQKIRAGFAGADAAREKALRLCRESIRYSSNAIRAIHRNEFDQARSAMESNRELLQEAREGVVDHPDLRFAGFMHDAQKEYAEACVTLALVRNEPLPTPEELGVGSAAYLHGMGEAVGEIRRHLLDLMRRDDLSGCEDLLSSMDDIYGVLVTMDFPDALTFGLRRTTDVVRGILEKTRGDLTIAMRQRDLEKKLDRLE
jgi:translin